MNRLSLLAFAAAIVLLAGCGAPAPRTDAAATTRPEYTLERFRHEDKIGDGVDTLVVDNPYGEIQLRQTSAAALAWQGVEQRIGAQPRIARIESFRDGARQGVRVRYAEHDPDQPANPRLGRVDIYVYVPARIRVDARADFGTISARRIDNDLRARTRNGMIVAATRGAVDAHSDSGEIRAWTMQAAGTTPTRLVTAGNVVADVPLFDDLAVEVRSARPIRADFPLHDSKRLASGVHAASWRNGDGAHSMQIESTAGEVVLQALRKPVP